MQEIICVLDGSGSMNSVKADAIGGFNQFLKDQKAIPEEANITVAWFDSGFSIGYEGPLKDCPELEQWHVGGMTAMYDGIGKAIAHRRPSLEKSDAVVIAILTDGEENSSREYSQAGIAALLTELQEDFNWDVIFLAADQDAWGVAQNLGIRKDMAFDYSSIDTAGGMRSYSSAVASSRLSNSKSDS